MFASSSVAVLLVAKAGGAAGAVCHGFLLVPVARIPVTGRVVHYRIESRVTNRNAV